MIVTTSTTENVYYVSSKMLVLVLDGSVEQSSVAGDKAHQRLESGLIGRGLEV